MTTIDFNALMQEAGEGFVPIPAGPYMVEVVKTEATTSSTQKPMIRSQLKVLGGPHNGRILFDQYTVSPGNPRALGFFFDNMAALGLDRQYFASNPPMQTVAQALLGRQCNVQVGMKVYQNVERNEVKNYRPIAGGSPTGMPGAMPIMQPGPGVPAMPMQPQYQQPPMQQPMQPQYQQPPMQPQYQPQPQYQQPPQQQAPQYAPQPQYAQPAPPPEQAWDQLPWEGQPQEVAQQQPPPPQQPWQPVAGYEQQQPPQQPAYVPAPPPGIVPPFMQEQQQPPQQYAPQQGAPQWQPSGPPPGMQVPPPAPVPPPQGVVPPMPQIPGQQRSI